MFLVALFSIATTIDEEAPALARDLAQTAYEARLLLAGEPPWIVLRTAELDVARRVGASLRARGHQVIACDGAAVTAFADMLPVEAFSSDGAEVHGPGAVSLGLADLACVVRLTVRRTWQTTKKVSKREVAIGMAIATGGVILSKKVTKETTERHEDRDQLLVLFPKTGTPWSAAESDVDGASLPGGAGLTQAETFERFVQHVRSRCPAPYDDRLLRAKRPANDRALLRQLEETVHVLALGLLRARR